MELLMKLNIRIDTDGKYRRWGLFLCPYCLQEVERRICNGLVAKSCGCVTNKLKSEALKGKKKSKEHILNLLKSHKGMKGKHHTKETRIKQSKAHKGKKTEPFTQEHRQNISNSLKGKKHPKEQNQKHSERMKGVNNPMYGKSGGLSPSWEGGKSFEPYGIEFNKELKEFIFERDNYTCQNPDCLIENPKRLDCHHIDYDKQNNIPENVITLCISCHMKSNHNRNYFTEYYQNIIASLKKSWYALFIGK